MPMWLSSDSIYEKFFREGKRDKLHLFLSFFFWSLRQGSLFNSLGYVPFFIFYINALKKLLSYFIYCIMFSWNFPWASPK